MFGQTTDYRELANAEEEKAREMRMRKQQLGEKGLYPVDESKPSKRARIPQPVAFDYAVRPQIARDAEEEEEVMAGTRRVQKTNDSRMARIAKQLKGKP